jgi:hypothetical protein
MDKLISVLKSNIELTPYRFYNDFLFDVANTYVEKPSQVIFKMFENGDRDIYNSNYRISPITIPLLLSLFEQLSKYHKKALDLELYNNSATIQVLEFLYRADFFNIGGNPNNFSYPLGRNIIDFEDGYLGGFAGKSQRDEHRLRAYSLQDDELYIKIRNIETDDDKRDFLNSYYTYKVKEHFSELLFENDYTNELHNSFIDILSELITNGVLHSKSNTFALMFVDRFKTKFSISDNGIGFKESMEIKDDTFYYKSKSLAKKISTKTPSVKLDQKIINNLTIIFETLYYSSLKDRKGLFDLMINVVLKSKGYFRLHTDNCQVIISNRMMEQLQQLELVRNEIYKLHTSYSLEKVGLDEYENILIKLSEEMKGYFVDFYNKSIEKYNSDIKYSSIRFFKVRFRGVHVEVEIPNA